jgi:alanine dehydrogenase
VIGAAAQPGDRAPKLVTRKMISKMQKGAVVVDVSIDQGGCFETSHPTSHKHPTFVVDGVIHFCVPNMPGIVPKTATFALANEVFPYLQRLVTFGLDDAIRVDVALSRGVNIHEGKVVHPGLAKAYGIKLT